MPRPKLPRPVKTCGYCHASFEERYPWRPSQFCSRACTMQALADTNTKYPETAERRCEYCDEMFTATHKAVRQGKARFCSRSCKSHVAPRKSVSARLDARVKRSQAADGCWLWAASVSAYGYPVMSVDGQTVRVNRLMYERHNGPIPAGLLICHTCDVKRCVNPAHLVLGTHRTNARDKFRVGTQARKLTPAMVRRIRMLYGQGRPWTMRLLAENFGVSRHTIWCILRNKIWTHVR